MRTASKPGVSMRSNIVRHVLSDALSKGHHIGLLAASRRGRGGCNFADDLIALGGRTMKTLSLALMVRIVAICVAGGVLAPTAVARRWGYASEPPGGTDSTQRLTNITFGHVCEQVGFSADCKVYQSTYIEGDGSVHSVNVYVEPDTKIIHVFLAEHDKPAGMVYLIDLNGELLKVVRGKNEGGCRSWTIASIDQAAKGGFKSVADGFKKEIEYWNVKVNQLEKGNRTGEDNAGRVAISAIL